jgi:hypothetical protein
MIRIRIISRYYIFISSNVAMFFLFQILSPEMSLATVRAYIWKKTDDLVLNYRVILGK